MSGLLSFLPARGTADPPFADARAAREWLKLLPLINTPVAHAELLEAISGMNRSRLGALDSLKTLEQFRDTVHQIQDNWQTTFLGKPLPLNPGERSHWQHFVDLWNAMADGYARCWRAAAEGDAGVGQYQALLAGRSLYYRLRMHYAHALVHRSPPQAGWDILFAYYKLIMQQGLAQERFRDSLSAASGTSHCESLFIQALLFAAGNPQQLSTRQQQWLHPVLENLAPRTSLGTQAAAPEGHQPLSIDLDHPSPPLRRPPADGQSSLAIDTLQLAQSLIKRIKLLRQGEAPQQLGLGSTLSTEAAEQLLRELYKHWCEHPGERKLGRKPQQAELQVAGGGIGNQHRWLAQGLYAPPAVPQKALGNRDMLDIQMFGKTTTRFTAPVLQAPELENWSLVDESVLGLRMERGIAGTRLQLQQLLTLTLDGQRFCGSIRWLEIGDEKILAGVRLLPGLPAAAAVRAIDAVRLGQEHYTDALRLPPMPALKEPASLLLPPGWFRQGRVLELWDGQAQHKVRLQSLLERGSDFERAHFVPAGT
ncbi:hypothetical protein [Chitinilyticum litopenaei]|uniref:hypothetical protein n=1 Tax=Chitinilyticum litopenaei TaxID=1121276 RepID=UPI00041FD29A|nr:hypothetical protein [Chitinilyticum litopenaei]